MKLFSSCLSLACAIALVLATGSLARADYYIDISNLGPQAQAVSGGSRVGPYSSEQQAIDINKAYYQGMGTVIGSSNAPSGGTASGTNFRQQMLNSAAQQIGQDIGQEIGKALFGDPEEEARQRALAAQAQAQQEEMARQEQIRQEQLRLNRIQAAAGLRATWDGRDQVMSQELDGVFDLPASHRPGTPGNDDTSVVDLTNTPTGGSTAFFGTGGNPDQSAAAQALQDNNDTSVVDLRGTSAGGDPAAAPAFNPIGASPDSSVVSLGGAGIQLGTISPNPSPSQQIQNTTGSAPESINYLGVKARDWAYDQSRQWAKQQASGFFQQAVQGNFAWQYFGAPAWGRAYSVWQYGENLNNQFQTLSHAFQTEDERALTIFERDATLTVRNMASPGGNDPASDVDPIEDVAHLQDSYDNMALRVVRDNIGATLETKMMLDEKIALAGNATADKPLIVPLDVTESHLGYSPWPTQIYHIFLGEAGYQ
jgi:hypothetical protein